MFGGKFVLARTAQYVDDMLKLCSHYVSLGKFYKLKIHDKQVSWNQSWCLSLGGGKEGSIELYSCVTVECSNAVRFLFKGTCPLQITKIHYLCWLSLFALNFQPHVKVAHRKVIHNSCLIKNHTLYK